MAAADTPHETVDRPAPPRRRALRILAVAVILAGLGVTAAAVGDQIRVRGLLRALRDPDPATRIKALTEIANEREVRARPVLADLLANEKDRDVLDMAGYAAMRVEVVGLVDTIKRRATEESDDAVRAKLIAYTARMSRRDVRLIPWLEAGLRAENEPWRQVASAAGLLYVGEPRGGPALIALARQPDHPARAMALAELNGLVGPMTEAVGWSIAWPTTDREPEPAFWAGLDAFWKEHGTARLLNDVLTRRFTRDPRWVEFNRLIHAREKLAKWFE